MSQVEQTSEEVTDSLTGHDEMAIAEHFGNTVGYFMVKDAMMFARTLVFVTMRREPNKMNDDDARNAAMDMPFKQVMDYFADAKDEGEEAGKGEPVVEPQPLNSLSSVS